MLLEPHALQNTIFGILFFSMNDICLRETPFVGNTFIKHDYVWDN